jgi:hypothetical protein
MDTIVDQFDAAEPEGSDAPNTLDVDIDVTFQKRRFTTLHLQEPKAKQLERAEMELNVANTTPYHFRRYQIALIAAVAKVPVEVIGELTNTQLVRAWGFLQDQLSATIPETGET